VLIDQGYLTDDEPEEQSVPVSTSITEDIYKLCYSGLLVLLTLIMISFCVYYGSKCCCWRHQQYEFDRNRELEEIRRK
jgi:hypothetical protein